MTAPFDWLVVRPLAQTNWIGDPSFEYLALTGAGPWTLSNSASGSNPTVWSGGSTAYRGPSCLVLPAGATTQAGNYIASQTVNVSNASDAAVLSAWVYLSASESEQVGIQAGVAGVYHAAYADPTILNRWQRVSLALSGVGVTHTSVTVYAIVTNSHAASGVIRFDAFQLENGTELSTYLDGDQDGCLWSGAPLLSASVRTLACRTGGVETSIASFLQGGGGLSGLTGMKGVGAAVQSHVTLQRGIQGGTLYQRSLRQERTFEIDATVVAPSDMDSLFALLGGGEELLSPDIASPQAPTTLVYVPAKATGKQLETDAVLVSGLEPYDSLQGLTVQSLALQFKAPEPYFRERSDGSAALSSMAAMGSCCYRPGLGVPGFVPVSAGSYAGTGVTGGAWVNNGGVLQLWLYGTLSTYGTTSANIITFTPSTGAVSHLGSGSNLAGSGDGGPIYSICQAGPNSNYVFISGYFASFVDGSGASHAYKGLVRYNLTTGAIDQPSDWGAGLGTIRALAYDPRLDQMYMDGGPYAIHSPNAATCGTHLNYAQWGQGPNGGYVTDMMVGTDGSCYYATNSGLYGVYRGAADSTSWDLIGTLADEPALGVHTMQVGPDGCLYMGGHFDTLTPGGAVYGLGRFNGSSWQPLGGRVIGSGLANTDVTSMGFDPSGRLHIAGEILSGTPAGLAGAINAETLYAVYDGNTMVAGNVYPESTTADQAHTPVVCVNPQDGGVFIWTNVAAPDTTSSYAAPTTVNYPGTAPGPVRFSCYNPSGNPAFGSLRNERTGKGIYFNGLTLAAGEVLNISTAPGKARVWSNLRPDLSMFLAPQSDLETFTLLPGANWITVYVASASVTATLAWRARHGSIDGTAASIATPSFAAL